MMAADEAPLTEEDVRDRVNLRHQNLADVRSLSLPGTYHEKITNLGNSLKKFVCLKSLDLSRNALTTLEGLQHLTSLEKLNLYFNHISSLSEVFRLHTLTALKDVDLRLNPVVKNESDYRLFVIHMLPNLRQLDDRPVRDSERKASLLHFTTDDACKFKKSALTTKRTEVERSLHPRAEYINVMSKKCLVMDEDDEAVLNLIAKCEWDLNKPRRLTGSSQTNPDVKFHDLKSIYKIEDNTGRHWKTEHSQPQFVLLKKKWKEPLPKDGLLENRNMLSAREGDKEYRNLPNSPILPVTYGPLGQGHEKRKIGVRVAFLEDKPKELLKTDANLKFQDEPEANEKITNYACFTPHPAPPGVSEPLAVSSKATRHNQIAHELEEQIQSDKGNITQGTIQVTNKVPYDAAAMEHLLDLVDKYWNGRKSLHCNHQFLSQAETVFSEVQKSVPTEHQKKSPLEDQNLNNLLLEKKTLEKNLSQQQEDYSDQINNLKADLDNYKKEMEVLKQHLDKLLKENAALKVQNSIIEQNIQKTDTATPEPLQISKLENQNQLLTDENASLKERLQHINKMQELTEMLQESHRTLVSTNERLLKELDETRLRHKAEVEQLRWNYNHLKKTGDTPPSNASNVSNSK
ncbi:centrosomal protein of 72 kDa isoform X1 [Anolis carolinensis]|uniref:centrosomal protein of 72 kDa isoform X1 n=1 Tax=Anolis carolinensis TaxID=28377 RepID=UPI002F2B8DF1